MVAVGLAGASACGAGGHGSPGPGDLERVPVAPAAQVVVSGTGIEPGVVEVAPDDLVELRIDGPAARCVASLGDVELRTGWQRDGAAVALRLGEPGAYELRCERDDGGTAEAELRVSPRS